MIIILIILGCLNVLLFVVISCLILGLRQIEKQLATLGLIKIQLNGISDQIHGLRMDLIPFIVNEKRKHENYN